MQAHLLDARGNPVPIGVAGELCLSGPGLARGYLGRPDRTAASFVPNPLATLPGERLYRTGDLARRLPDGEIEFLGRLDHQVKVRGFRIEPGEIEEALTRLAGVREAAVIAREDVPGDRRLVAYVVGDADAAALRSSLRERLPDHMVPSAFVTLAAFPMTPNGKVDRKALPAPERQGLEGSPLAPLTPVEELLVGIWAEVLGTERIGPADHFFDLGGHSLLAAGVISRLRRAFGIEMPLRVLFEAPVLADLARRVEAELRAGVGSSAPPLVPVPRDLPLPLSFAQQRLWFIDQLERGSPLYNIPVALRVQGPRASEVLARSLGEVVHRHEILRTVFAAPQGSPVQVIQPAASFRLPVVDLSGLPARVTGKEIEHLQRDEARRPFDLEREPPLRGRLFDLGSEEWVLFLTLHHIATDGWSRSILTREIGAAYRASLKGRSPELVPLPVQYADFAAWQRSWLQGETLAGQLAWWREQLAGALTKLDLPADRPRSRSTTRRWIGAAEMLELPADLSRRVAEAARRAAATPFMLLLAAFGTFLSRHTGQEDLLVGIPVAGRHRPELEQLIGLFLNTVVLRQDLSGDPGFGTLLQRVRDAALDVYARQDLPFEKLVEELSPERDPGRTPLYQVQFNFLNVPRVELDVPGMTVRALPSADVHAKLDLAVYSEEVSGRFALRWVYDASLFDAATIRRAARHFASLLEAAVDDSSRRLAGLPLLSEEETHQIRSEWNDTGSPSSSGLSLPERFFAAAARWPEAVALRLGGGAISYAELARRVQRRAAGLKRRGTGLETVTTVRLGRSFEMVETVLAILAAGGAYAALDPRSPQGARERQLETGDGTGPGLPGPAGPDSLAYVSFTSGSTGAPKGILGTHGAVASYLDYLDEAWPMSPDDRVLQLARLSFDASIRDLLHPLTRGAGVVLLSDDEARDPAALLREIRAHGVTRIPSAVPSLLQALVEQAAAGAGGNTVDLILASGEPLSLALCQRLREVFGRSVRIANQYGPSECTMTSTVCPVPSGAPGTGMAAAGRPIPGMRCRILDARLHEVPVHVTGQVFLGGAGVTRGYLNRPDLTAERFLPDPFSAEPGERLYATGDLGRLSPDGSLELLGRLDRQVKIRGNRLEPGEVEAALGEHPEVETSVVTVREGRLVAYVVCPGGPPAGSHLRSFLLERLPEHAVPSLFVHLETLPLTPNGKLDRRALPAPEWRSPEESHLAPGTPVEQILAEIWAELLGVEQVGASDHFFELGGHSLLATRVLSRLRAAFNVEIPLRELFESPKLADLAARVESALRAGAGRVAPPLVPVAPALREGPLPLSFAQQRLWFFDQLQPRSPLYNMPVTLRIEGSLDWNVLTLCLGEVVRRHETLRTVFSAREGSPVQVVQPAAPFTLSLVDLSELPERAREAPALASIRDEAGRPFDLARGPLLRAVLLRLGDGHHVFGLTMHHIVSDAWSMGILVREVLALYGAFVHGGPSPLPELPVQYPDFSVWQRSWLNGEVLESEISFWRRQLAGLPPLLELPTDRPRPAVQSFHGASRPVRLSAGLVRQAQVLGRREGATLFMVLLAGFQALLARYSGQRELAVGTPVAGRNRVEIEGLIGFFVNTLVLRGDLTGEPSSRALLGRVRETALAAYMHQDVPFEKLVEELAPERSLAQSPLFQAMFVLQNAPAEGLDLPGLRLSPVGGARTTARFDLTLNLGEHEGGVAGAVEHATDLFDATTIDRLIGHFERLVAGTVATPDLPASALPLLSTAEHQQTLVEWNDTSRRVADGALAHEPISSAAERDPDALAVAWDGGEMTYGELERRSNRLAHRLRRLGVGPEVAVGLCVDRSGDMVVGLLGILKSGGAYVPLDPEFPRERLEASLADCGAPVLVAQERTAGLASATGALPVLLDGQELDDGLEDDGPPAPGALPGNPAYIIYTSGSTGRPKGVVVTHQDLVNSTSARLTFYREPVEAYLLASSFAFDSSVAGIFWTLWDGGTLLLHKDQFHLDLRRFLGTLERLRASHLLCLPSLYSLILEHAAPGQLVSLKTVIVGGEACPAALVAHHQARLPSVSLVNEYGPTEGTVWSSASVLATTSSPVVPIGRPIDNVRLYLLDPAFRPVPANVPGELWIGGETLARGYLNRPDLTAERFLPDPFPGEPGARLYRTGDQARWTATGELQFLGRIDQQVKIRGFRIELAEIEAVLVALATVREAAVVAREDLPGERRLVAYVTGDVSVPLLRKALRERLPGYMVPAAFVVLAALPLTPNGKVDRQALPAPEPPDSGETHVAPRTPAEDLLAGIWAELFGLERVDVTHDFFDLGGHSLLAVRLMARIEQIFGVKLPTAALFETPTVEHLAGVIQGAPLLRSALVRLHLGGPGRPLFLVHPAGGDVFDYLGLAKALGAERPVYGLQAVEEGNGHPPRMEDMAAHYLASVREVQPEGPWLLAGWSSGAVMAYEMARQIESSGGSTSLLTMFDPPPPPDGRGEQADDTQLLARFAALAGPTELQKEALREMLEGLDLDAGLDRLHEMAQAEGVLVGVSRRWLRERFDLYSRTVSAVQGYVPRHYGGRVSLFRASASLAPGATDLTAGWGLLAKTEAHLIPDANHISLLKMPALVRLVEYLQRDLAMVERWWRGEQGGPERA